MAKVRRVIAPSHPGFGRSALPDWIDGIDDIAHIYLELMDRMGLTRVDLVGFSVGGWIAAEIATKVPERLVRLALIGPVGVKTGSPDKLDIPDVFAMPQDKLDRLRFHDPRKNPVDLGAMSDEELNIVARNSETLALLTWEPYMHNPKLKHRLHRVSVPTLFLRGAERRHRLGRISRTLRGARSQGQGRDHRGGRASAACRAARGDCREGPGFPAILMTDDRALRSNP